MNFKIVIMSSSDAAHRYHSQGLLPVAQAMSNGLVDLGHKAEIGTRPDRYRINIVLGYHHLSGKRLPPGYDFIVYQLEQFPGFDTDTEMFRSFKTKALLTLASCEYIWDFSQQNVAFLQERGIRAIHKPIGFHPAMFMVQHEQKKDIDFLFYGSKNDRRLAIMDKLAEKYRAKYIFGCYGEKRDAWLARSKVALGIHFFKSRLFDEVRASYFLNNKVFSVMEDTPYKKYTEVIEYTAYDKIIETCERLVNKPKEISRRREKSYEYFSNFPEKDFLEQALDETLLPI